MVHVVTALPPADGTRREKREGSINGKKEGEK
jgi:hypothetical protein